MPGGSRILRGVRPRPPAGPTRGRPGRRRSHGPGLPGPGPPKADAPPHHLERGFRNLNPDYARPGLWTRWRFVIPRLLSSPRKAWFPIVVNDGRALRENAGAATVTWVGHSTLLVQLDGVSFLTDPQWSERASPVTWAGPRRVTPPALRFEDLPPIDLVLISHDHYDHLDAPTVQRLWAPTAPLPGAARLQGVVRRARDRRGGRARLVGEPDRQGPHGRVHAGPALERAEPPGREPPALGELGRPRQGPALLLRGRHGVLRPHLPGDRPAPRPLRPRGHPHRRVPAAGLDAGLAPHPRGGARRPGRRGRPPAGRDPLGHVRPRVRAARRAARSGSGRRRAGADSTRSGSGSSGTARREPGEARPRVPAQASGGARRASRAGAGRAR